MDSLYKEKVAAEFGRYIHDARERKGMLQATVAGQLGVSRAYYSMIEAGKREIYFTLAIRICRILSISLDDFVERMASYETN